jgi:hypothetical protein
VTEIIRLGHQHYLIQSRTNPDNWYAIDDGGCTCRASDCLKPCWHVKAIEEIERNELRQELRKSQGLASEVPQV